MMTEGLFLEFTCPSDCKVNNTFPQNRTFVVFLCVFLPICLQKMCKNITFANSNQI